MYIIYNPTDQLCFKGSFHLTDKVHIYTVVVKIKYTTHTTIVKRNLSYKSSTNPA